MKCFNSVRMKNLSRPRPYSIAKSYIAKCRILFSVYSALGDSMLKGT